MRSRAEAYLLCVSIALVGHYTIMLLAEYINAELDFTCCFLSLKSTSLQGTLLYNPGFLHFATLELIIGNICQLYFNLLLHNFISFPHQDRPRRDWSTKHRPNNHFHDQRHI